MYQLLKKLNKKVSERKVVRCDSKYPNKDTEFINGTFNVKTARKYLKSFITNTLGYTGLVDEKEFPKIGTINAQYPYSACAEIFVLYLVRASGSFATRNSSKADLYEVNLENLQRGIREKRDFGVHITALSESYNPTSMDYTANFFDNVKTLKRFIEQHAFTNTTNVHLDLNSNVIALNFICYIVSNSLSLLTRTSCIMSVYAKKKNIQVKNFKYACDIHFSGELGALIKQRVTEIEGLLANRKERKEDDSKEQETTNEVEKRESDNEDDSDNTDNETESDNTDNTDDSDDDSDASD